MRLLSKNSNTSARASNLFAALLVVGLLLAGCGNDNNQESAPGYQVGEPVEDGSIAAIVTSDFGSDTLYAQAFQSQLAQTGQPPQQIIEGFIAQHVVTGEADQLGLQVEHAELEQHMEALKAQFPDEESYQAALDQQGMTEESLRETMVQSLRMQQMEEQLARGAEEPGDAEVEEFQTERSHQVSAQHILFRVPEDAGDEARAEIRERAEAVLDSVKAGEDFAELARRHSEDGTAERGGDLGYLHRGQTVEPFDEAVFALPDSGDVTPDLVQTQFGYHIIRKTGEQEADAMDPQQARMMMMQQRRQEAIQDELDRLMSRATVHVNSEVTGVNLNDQ